MEATLSKHFWQPHPLLVRLVSGTPLARCADRLHGLEAKAESRSCWQDLASETASAAHPQSQQHWGHRAAEVSTDDHRKILLEHRGLVQLELLSQPGANPQMQHLQWVIAFVLSACMAQRPALACGDHLKFVGKHSFNDSPKISSVLLILYTFTHIWTHIPGSSYNLGEAIGFYWLFQICICMCFYSRYL